VHKFLFKQGSTDPVKNKYFCESCGLKYEPTKDNKLALFFEEREKLAKYIFNETAEYKLIKDVPADKIFCMIEKKLVVYTPHLTSLFFRDSCILRANKNDVFNKEEKVQVFISELGYKDFYIPIEYVI